MQEKDPATIERLQLIMRSFVDRVKDPEAFERSSALIEAPRVRFPLFIIDGGNDVSLPLWMVEEYAAKLRAAGKQVETYLPADLPHGAYGGNTKEAQRRSLEFLHGCLAVR